MEGRDAETRAKETEENTIGRPPQPGLSCLSEGLCDQYVYWEETGVALSGESNAGRTAVTLVSLSLLLPVGPGQGWPWGNSPPGSPDLSLHPWVLQGVWWSHPCSEHLMVCYPLIGAEPFWGAEHWLGGQTLFQEAEHWLGCQVPFWGAKHHFWGLNSIFGG